VALRSRTADSDVRRSREWTTARMSTTVVMAQNSPLIAPQSSIITILSGQPKPVAPRNPVKIMRNALPMAIMRVRRAAVPTLTHTLSSCAVSAEP